MDKNLQQLESLIGKKVQIDVLLAKYTTFKIGGPAKYFFVAKDNEDLVRAITFAKRLKITFYVLGGASNVLVSDQGFNGLIIINKAKDIIFKKDNKVVADAGANLMELVNETVAKGLIGLEWAAGIPGTVGGATRGNAGAYGGQISDNLIGCEIMRGSKQFILDKKNCDFGYRDSIFKHNNDLIISVEFLLQKGDKVALQNKIKQILAERRDKQPLEFPSAGCVFKNVFIDSTNEEKIKQIGNLPKEYLERKKIPAAWLIEQLDLKGKNIGGAQISDKHANFVINIGKATANDVIQLISLVKMKVRDTYGIELMEEIEYVGF
ncbi:MAG: UDP-N-acetylmuramate dehydrogenase [Candidatus Parcubacteria bacterium]|nr:UDP-N-acetylmuramate dehydrogenase [Candidatus Parcubacteria bacterium]